MPKATADGTLQTIKTRKRHTESEESVSDESDDEFDEECTGPLHSVVLTTNKCKKGFAISEKQA